MKIKLYNPNDTRPQGSYTNCRSAYGTSIYFKFTSSTGKTFVTNCNYKLELEPGDKMEKYQNEFSIIGAPKPQAQVKQKTQKKTASKTGQESLFVESEEKAKTALEGDIPL